MMTPLKSYFAGVATVYLFVAVCFGASLGRIPALNWMGQLYVGATWPGAMFCVSTGLDCDVFPPLSISKHFFTFKDEPRP
jgi:hypothetical protein